MNSSNILVISGGNRTDSTNTKIARSLGNLAPEGMTLSYADISSLPMFNQDLEAALPTEVVALKEAIKTSDGVIFVTPEHNRSIPAVLKNALDWASRPYGTNAWAGKPAIMMGATGGMVGTSLAQAHLRQIALYLGMHVLGQPEVYITGVNDKVGADGSITDTKTQGVITNALTALSEFVTTLK